MKRDATGWSPPDTTTTNAMPWLPAETEPQPEPPAPVEPPADDEVPDEIEDEPVEEPATPEEGEP